MWNFNHSQETKTEGDANASKANESQAAPKTDQSKDAPAPQGEGDKFDDFGYEKTEPEGDKKPEGSGDKKPEVPKETSTKVETPATGYGEKDPVVEEPPAPAPKKEEIDLGYELKVEGVPEEDVTKLKTFAKQYALSKEAAQAYLDLRKAEHEKYKASVAESEREYEIEKQKVRAEWHRELKNDPAFGGEKFGSNILRAEKVMEEFMPNTKKVLTERKAMLPPYVMRDLAKLADHLYSTERLVQGDAPKPSEPVEEKDDALAFYT
jgi:hypothetical protein